VTRRLAVLSVAVVGLLSTAALSSCSSFEERANVASVGDSELDQDEFELISRNPYIASQSQEIVDDTVTGDTARGIITRWVVATALADGGFLDTLTDEDAVAWLDASGVAGWDTGDDAVPFLLDYAKFNLAVQQGSLGAEAEEYLQSADVFVASRYGEWDNSTGVLPLGDSAQAG
jgi:hypothetical protein